MRTVAVTGAYGKTGRAVAAALAPSWRVRALARTDAQRAELAEAGYDVVVGDMTDGATLAALVDGADAVYHICPNFHPDEVAIGSVLAESTAAVDRFVYHSVLHPQTEAMPHHWRKLRVEEVLLAGRGGRVTFLRPAPYVQNLAPYVETAVAEGELRIPYSVDTPTAMVDLADVGRAAAAVLADDFDHGSGWDLCGIGAVSHRTIATRLSDLGPRPIAAVEVPPAPGIPDELGLMFDYMGANGLPGSTGQLRALIGEPTPFEDSLRRLLTDAGSDAESAAGPGTDPDGGGGG